MAIASETGDDKGALTETPKTTAADNTAPPRHQSRDNALRQGYDVRRSHRRKRPTDTSRTRMCWREKVDRRGTVSTLPNNDALVFNDISHEQSSSSTVTSEDEPKDTATSSSEAATYFEGNESPTVLSTTFDFIDGRVPVQNEQHLITDVRNDDHDNEAPSLCSSEADRDDAIDLKVTSSKAMHQSCASHLWPVRVDRRWRWRSRMETSIHCFGI